MPRTVVVERDWDTESVRSDRNKNYTVKRYKVPDRSTYEDDRYETDIKITKRETERERPEYRDVRYEREVERERPQREVRGYRVAREVERAPSPPEPEYREWRVEREVTREAPPRRAPYELERYTRDVEWVREAERPQEIIIRREAPQPIIIHETAPPQEIVIREERREEPKLEVMPEARSIVEDRRSEVDNRSLVRREPEPPSDEEDYYFKRVTRKVQRRPQSEYRDDDEDDYVRESYPRRDVDPRDSVSNNGDGYSSDERYYKKTTTTEQWDSRDRSPDHRLHLAEGAAVGLAGAAFLKNRQKNGSKSGGAAKLAGGAALGAVGAELITRARAKSRYRSRSGGRRRRSRSSSRPKINSVAKVGAVAVLGALAAYAASRNNEAKAPQNDRRSRSRRRRSSVARSASGSRNRSGSGDRSGSKDMRDQSTRNATIAKAGLASAAVAGLVDRMRSKSRGGRKKSVGRSALPVAAAGLGGAALAGLYANNKGMEQEKSSKKQSGRGRSQSNSPRNNRPKSKNRSRSRSVANTENQQDSSAGNQNLVVYGNDPIPPPDSYARPQSRSGSLYGDGGNGGRDRGGSPGSSRSSSPRRDRRHRRKGDSAGGAGISGAAASGASERRERKRQEREQRRLQEHREETPSNVGWGPYAEPIYQNQDQNQPQYQPVPVNNQSYYPQSTNFPPPPQNTYSPGPGPVYNHATYNPTEYSAPGAVPGHARQAGVTAATEGQWYPPAQDNQYGGNYNVSRPNITSSNDSGWGISSVGVATAGLPEDLQFRRRKSVQFDPNPTEYHVVERPSVSGLDGNHHDPGFATRQRSTASSSGAASVPPCDKDGKSQRSNGQPRAELPLISNDSGDTITLPDRFDKNGRRKDIAGSRDSLAAQLEGIISGRGTFARLLLRTLAEEFLGAGAGAGRTRR